MVAEPWGSDSGDSDFWVNHLDQGQASADSAQPSALDRTWVRLVQRVLNLRHLQRVFANVGQYLRNNPRSLLDRTSRNFPNQRWVGQEVQVEAQSGQQGLDKQNKSLHSCCCSCSKGKRRLPERHEKVYRSWQMDSRNLQLDQGLLMWKGLESPISSKVVMRKFRNNGSPGVTNSKRGSAVNGLLISKL